MRRAEVKDKYLEQAASPIISTRALPILEVVKPFIVPNNELPPDDPRHDLDCVVTVTAYPEILDDPKRRPSRRAYQPISNCQPLAVVEQCLFLGLLINVMEHISSVRHINLLLHHLLFYLWGQPVLP